jgi:dienelactone hydrolase
MQKLSTLLRRSAFVKGFGCRPDASVSTRYRGTGVRKPPKIGYYPGARHGFDAPRPPHVYAGHDVGQDPAALADSLIETRRFFDQRLIAQH